MIMTPRKPNPTRLPTPANTIHQNQGTRVKPVPAIRTPKPSSRPTR
jgi:hypothetical protein